MMAGSTRSVRVGDSERAEAQRALQHHLGAGRLQLAEFVQRFARAADAVTAEEIAALFADLPAPHPRLPGPPHERSRRSLAVVGAIVALALVGSLGFVIGRGQTEASSDAVAAPTPNVPPASRASGTALQRGPAARRSGGAPARD
jgi:hypothetical protein